MNPSIQKEVPGTQIAQLIGTRPQGRYVASQAGCIISAGHLLNLERNLSSLKSSKSISKRKRGLPGKGWDREVLFLLGMLDLLQKYLLEAAYIFG